MHEVIQRKSKKWHFSKESLMSGCRALWYYHQCPNDIGMWFLHLKRINYFVCVGNKHYDALVFLFHGWFCACPQPMRDVVLIVFTFCVYYGMHWCNNKLSWNKYELNWQTSWIEISALHLNARNSLLLFITGNWLCSVKLGLITTCIYRLAQCTRALGCGRCNLEP